MNQLNQLAVHVTVLSPTTFSIWAQLAPFAIPIDSTTYTAFTTPSLPQFTAEVIPIGSGATPYTGPPAWVTNNICDSFVEDATTNIDQSEIPF
jgi:hypothetical protein